MPCGFIGSTTLATGLRHAAILDTQRRFLGNPTVRVELVDYLVAWRLRDCGSEIVCCRNIQASGNHELTENSKESVADYTTMDVTDLLLQAILSTYPM